MRLLFLLVCILSTAVNQADAQGTTYDFVLSGRLTEPNGKPVQGPVAMQVKFYHTPTNGTAVLTVTAGLESVTLQEGVFKIKLNLDAADYQTVFPSPNQETYFEITDLTNAPLTPYERNQVTVFPYAAKIPFNSNIFTFGADGKFTLAATPSSGKYLKANADGSLSWDTPASGISDSSATTFTNKTIDADTNTITNISNTNIKDNAAISDSKLATISTAGKVSGDAVTSGTIGGSTQVATSGTIATTGKAGIGAAAGTSQLEVKGGGTTNTTSSLNVKNASDGSLLFVRDDGRVGIGTASPTQFVTIHKDQNAATSLSIFNTATGSSAQAGAGVSRTTDFSNDYLSWGVTSSGYSLAGYDHVGYFHSKGVPLKFGSTDAQPVQIFSNGITNPRITVDAAGAVGIGTSSPANALTVNKASPTADEKLLVVQNSGVEKFSVDEGGDILAKSLFLNGQVYGGLYSDTAGHIYFGSQYGIKFEQISGLQLGAGSTVFDFGHYADRGINSDQNFMKLNYRINSGNANSYGLLITEDAGYGTTPIGKLFGASYNGSSRFVIQSDGNVGIGTTTPSHAFTIERNDSTGSGSGPGLTIKNTNANDPAGSGYNIAWSNYYAGNGAVLAQFGANYGTGSAAPWNKGSGFYVNTRTDHPIIFGTGSTWTEKMRITSGGHVGIGQTSFGTNAAKLHIKGGSPTSLGTDVILRVDGGDSSVGALSQIGFGWHDSTYNALPSSIIASRTEDASNYTKSGLIFATRSVTTNTAPTERMRIGSDGNVGIGTTSPQSTLQVNGYVQLALTSGAPPAGDCDDSSERGRMKVDSVNSLLYICMDSGWVAK